MALPLGQIVRNEANSRADSNGPGSARYPCRRWGQSCETKPIFPQALYGKGVVSRRQPTGILRNKANCHRRAGMGEGGQGRPCRYHWVKACQTKPIAARTTMGQGRQGASAAGGADRAKRSQLSRQALYGKGVVSRRQPTGILRNKANCHRRAGMGEGGQGRPCRYHWVKAVRNKANCRTDNNGPGSARHQCRRWGQSCETKPISRQVLYGKGVASRRQPTGILRNEANFRGTAAFERSAASGRMGL